MGSSLVVVQTKGLTGAGEQACKLSIVTQVKKRAKSLESSAFLDPGTSAYFWPVGLNSVSGENIVLLTMGQGKLTSLGWGLLG